MVTQLTHLVGPLVLCALLALPADAQKEGVFEGSPTDFLPLQVGNQWTYMHWYHNYVYGSYSDDGFDFSLHEREAIRAVMEIPGYPLFVSWDDLVYPPLDLAESVEIKLTIEITHTETIEGRTYFVFSKPAYDWPPMPNLCLAGQKVRFSDAGVLLIRRQGQDMSVYDFAPPYIYKDYTTPAYPVLYDAHALVSIPLVISRSSWDTRSGIRWHWFYPPPLSFGPAFVTLFTLHMVEHMENDSFVSPWFGSVYFLANYGLARYELFEPGWDWYRTFENSLTPVSAVIGGKEIAYPYVHITSVQPTSWGQIKALHGKGP